MGSVRFRAFADVDHGCIYVWRSVALPDLAAPDDGAVICVEGIDFVVSFRRGIEYAVLVCGGSEVVKAVDVCLFPQERFGHV